MTKRYYKENGHITVAIIGTGPRGLSALESLYQALANQERDACVKTLVFEATDQLGNGPVYDCNQADTNWMNVSERGLTIPGRKEIQFEHFDIPAFPSYQDWANYDELDSGSEPDYFPLRSKVGNYLQQRFESISQVLMEQQLLEIVKEKVVHLDFEDTEFTISTLNGDFYKSNEVVLTIGHQPTRKAKQIEQWEAQIEEHQALKLFVEPYPVKVIQDSVEKSETVMLRGFGLAMIDVVRALTTGLGGTFDLVNKITRQMKYIPSKELPLLLVPFSLDGLPMTPKPLNKHVDKWFMPTKTEINVFKEKLEKYVSLEDEAEDGTFVIEAIMPIIINKFTALEEYAYPTKNSDRDLREIVTAWLLDGKLQDELIVPKDISAHKSMKSFTSMANGTGKISLDYCAGQVWRHCQPTMYEVLSFTNLDDEVIADLVQRDERLKRYTYGPPVDSLQQIIAIVEAGEMTFDYISNPKIKVTSEGWLFEKNNKKITGTIMVDTVLDSPDLLKVDSPIIETLLKNSLVEPIHGALGIDTTKNALVELIHGKHQVPLAVLGRLAKGTIIGVDAILECFGERSNYWAKGVIQRLSNYNVP